MSCFLWVYWACVTNSKCTLNALYKGLNTLNRAVKFDAVLLKVVITDQTLETFTSFFFF